jgi:hypothetical protein
MPCPFFVYTAAVFTSGRDGFYAGECAADPGRSIAEETLRSCCNPGHARTRCAQADGSAADAVQFLIRRETGAVLEIAWAIERDHHPIAVGRAEVGSPGTASLGTEIPDTAKPNTGNPVLDRQIVAYARTIRR